MDLLLIRLEKIDNDFYESLIKFISDHGYSPKVVVRNTDILSFHGLKIISSKHQVLLHDKEIKMTKKEFYILELLARNKGQVILVCFLRYIIFMSRFGEKAIFLTVKISSPILTKSVRK